MLNDDLQHKILTKLNQKAKNHHHKQLVMDGVFSKIAQKQHDRFNRWGIAGFALAAAITGIVVIPNSFLDEPQNQAQITVNTPKLTPQLADDLEMLLVLGEDTTHGS